MPIMSQKSKEYVFASWVHPVIATTTYTFAQEGSLDRDFLDLGHSLDRGVLTSKKDKRIYSEYGECTIPFY